MLALLVASGRRCGSAGEAAVVMISMSPFACPIERMPISCESEATAPSRWFSRSAVLDLAFDWT